MRASANTSGAWEGRRMSELFSFMAGCSVGVVIGMVLFSMFAK